MARVRTSGTDLEIACRRALRLIGVGYRLGGWKLPGSPDIVLPGRRLAVFVHGCFWHAHDCTLGGPPKVSTEFWAAKRRANRARDRRVEDELRAQGWTVLVVWGCDVKAGRHVELLLAAVRA
jgi:DNA mismatch endonuclease (patch repair protein)